MRASSPGHCHSAASGVSLQFRRFPRFSTGMQLVCRPSDSDTGPAPGCPSESTSGKGHQGVGARFSHCGLGVMLATQLTSRLDDGMNMCRALF